MIACMSLRNSGLGCGGVILSKILLKCLSLSLGVVCHFSWWYSSWSERKRTLHKEENNLFSEWLFCGWKVLGVSLKGFTFRSHILWCMPPRVGPLLEASIPASAGSWTATWQTMSLCFCLRCWWRDAWAVDDLPVYDFVQCFGVRNTAHYGQTTVIIFAVRPISNGLRSPNSHLYRAPSADTWDDLPLVFE